MKSLFPFVAAASLVTMLAVWGCLPGVRTVKTGPDTGDRPRVGQPAEKEKSPSPKASAPEAPAPLPPPPPGIAGERAAEGPVDLRQRAEVNQAALDFAKHLTRVKHIKTCWSKADGEWYLHIYVDEGKSVSMQQFIWKAKVKEWEPIFQMKEVPATQLDFHLKSELEGEKCFLLKK